MALLRAIGMMLEKEDPENIPRQIATAIATVLKADIAVLISSDDTAWADVLAAYDHIQQRLIPGLALHLEEQPTILNAIERKVQRPLYVDRNINELIDLYTRLDIKQLGPAYIQPLMRSARSSASRSSVCPHCSSNRHGTSLLAGPGRRAPVGSQPVGAAPPRGCRRSRAASRG
jgi:hypothetical protein